MSEVQAVGSQVREARCRAYTYTKPGTYGNPQARCWLKETQGRFVTHEGAVSAVKK